MPPCELRARVTEGTLGFLEMPPQPKAAVFADVCLLTARPALIQACNQTISGLILQMRWLALARVWSHCARVRAQFRAQRAVGDCCLAVHPSTPGSEWFSALQLLAMTAPARGSRNCTGHPARDLARRRRDASSGPADRSGGCDHWRTTGRRSRGGVGAAAQSVWIGWPHGTRLSSARVCRSPMTA